ncbi:MAG: MBL fold metallo-hydrolase, partial [Methyloligellaceae bacterium]
IGFQPANGPGPRSSVKLSTQGSYMNKPGSTAPSASKLAFNTEMHFDYGVASEVAPNVRRIVANNPGPFTFKGTNTYLVGRGEVAVIDPGPDDRAHLDAIAEAVKGERISHILITHTHRDHTDAVAALKEYSNAPVLAFGHTGKPRGARTTSPSGKAFVDLGFTPDAKLRGGDTVSAQGWALDVIHTPGHAPDHLCFALQGQRSVFSGDHVMGWNTSVVAPPEGNMGDYLASLERMLERRDKLFFPAHGGRIEMPQRVIRAYLLHRKMRESAIYACLVSGDRFIPQIVPKIYARLDPMLATAAALSVLAHLELLVDRGRVQCEELPAAIHSAFSIPPDAPPP